MSGWSRAASIATFWSALVGCAAAVVVIPEFRCAVGMEEGMTLRNGRCAKAGASGGAVLSLGFLPLPPPEAASARDASRDQADVATIARIKRQYDYIQSRRDAMHTWQRPMKARGAEEAYANLWSENGSVRLIRARFHGDGFRKALLFYYTDGELVFVHQVVKRLDAGDAADPLDEQRFYFDGDRLIRWLDVTRAGVPGGAGEYDENERRLRDLGYELLRAAGSPDTPIRL